MSWAEIKKAVNSDLSTPLNEQLGKSGIEVFTSSGTFEVPIGVNTIFVTMYDGGGGGGGGGTNSVNAHEGGAGGGAYGGAGGAAGAGSGAKGGGGGGAGGYILFEPLSVESNSLLTVTVGAGGAGSSNNTSGGAGGTSKISRNGVDLLLTNNSGADGERGGTRTNGTDVESGGKDGGNGGTAGGTAGGTGGAGGKNDYAGNNGGAYGGGAGGGGKNYGGGAGASGIVIISYGNVTFEDTMRKINKM